MPGGAPIGNQNAAKAKVWSDAIKRALERRSRERRSRADEREEIDAIADKFLDAKQNTLLPMRKRGPVRPK
jgi:hypothetical protein